MEQTKQNKHIVPIIMMIVLFAMISFVTNLAAPIGMIWKERFADSTTLGMMGNMMNFLAYLVMGIPAGILLQRIGYKKTALLAIAVGFLGVLIQFLSGKVGAGATMFGLPTTFIVYLLGAFVAGFSVCMLNTVVNPMLNTLGGGGNRGNQLLQIGGTFNSLAATLTPIFVGALIGTISKDSIISDVNPVLYIAMGVFAVVFVVLSAVKIPEPHIVKADPNAAKDKYSAWSFRHFVLGAIGIFIYVGVEVGIPGTMLFFLSDPAVGGAAAVAGSVAGTYWFLMMIGRFIGGAIGGKISSRSMLAIASSAALIFILIAIFIPTTITISMPVFTGKAFAMASVPINALFFVLCGLCTSVMWGGIFNLAVEGLGKYTAKASGIFMMMVCGGGILPLIQAGLVDGIGYMGSYWLVFAGFAFLLYYALIGSKNVNKDIKVD